MALANHETNWIWQQLSHFNLIVIFLFRRCTRCPTCRQSNDSPSLSVLITGHRSMWWQNVLQPPPGCDYTSTSHARHPTIWPFSQNNLPDAVILFRKYENSEVALLRDVKDNVKCWDVIFDALPTRLQTAVHISLIKLKQSVELSRIPGTN